MLEGFLNAVEEIMKDPENRIYRFDEVEIDPQNLRLRVGF